MGDDSDISDSDMNEYKEVAYKLLKFRTYKIKTPDGKFRCPFCADKEEIYQHSLLLQHAVQVAESSEYRAKQRANHSGMAKYLVNHAQLPPQDCYQSLAEKLKEKEAELASLMLKESETNVELQEARKALIQAFQISKGLPCHTGKQEIGIKKKGDLDLSKISDDSSMDFWQRWGERVINNPEWHPFWVENHQGITQRVINEDDEKLKDIKDTWGVEIYDAFVTALKERRGYNSSGCSPVPELWNFTENRNATLEEAINYLFDELKVLRVRQLIITYNNANKNS